jgi:hypothetical protein
VTFNIGGQTGGVINNVQGDQHITGGQQGILISTDQARQAVRELSAWLDTAGLDETTAAQARSDIAEIETAMRAPQPDRPRAAHFLGRLTQVLVAAGSLSTATTAVLGSLQTLAGWLGPLGQHVLHLLPQLG